MAARRSPPVQKHRRPVRFLAVAKLTGYPVNSTALAGNAIVRAHPQAKAQSISSDCRPELLVTLGPRAYFTGAP